MATTILAEQRARRPCRRGAHLGERNLFDTPGNALLTVPMLGLFALIIPPLVRWAVIDATFDGLSRRACAARRRLLGASSRRGSIRSSTGATRSTERWRVHLAFVLLALFAVAGDARGRPPPRLSRRWRCSSICPGDRRRAAGRAACSACARVDTNDWGGLMLNVVLAFVAVRGLAAARHPARARATIGAAGWCARCRSASSSCGAACRC